MQEALQKLKEEEETFKREEEEKEKRIEEARKLKEEQVRQISVTISSVLITNIIYHILNFSIS